MKVPKPGLVNRMTSSKGQQEPELTPSPTKDTTAPPATGEDETPATPGKRKKLKIKKTLRYKELYSAGQYNSQDESTEVEDNEPGTEPDFISTTALTVPVYVCPILTMSKNKEGPLISIPESVVDKLCQVTIANMCSQVYALNKTIGLAERYPSVGQMKEIAMKLCRYYPALLQLPVKHGKQRHKRGMAGPKWVC